MAFSALTTPNGADERSIYENIVGIPLYDSKWLELLDREDEQKIVDEFEG